MAFCDLWYAIEVPRYYISDLFSAMWYIGVVSYVIFLYALIKQRKAALSAPFFTICISVGVCDLGCLLANVIWRGAFFSRLASLMIAIGQPAAAYCFIGYYYWQRARDAGVVLICLNRLHAVFRPTTYDSWWRGHLSKLVAAQFIFGAVVASPVLTIGPFKYRWQQLGLPGVNNSLVPHISDLVYFSKYTGYLLALNVSRLAFYVLCLAAIAVKLRVEASKAAKNATGSNVYSKAELKLVVCSTVIIICDFGTFSFDLFKLVMLSGGARPPTCFFQAFVMYVTTVNDMYGWINPLIVFSTSSLVRDSVLQLFGLQTVAAVDSRDQPSARPAANIAHISRWA